MKNIRLEIDRKETILKEQIRCFEPLLRGIGYWNFHHLITQLAVLLCNWGTFFKYEYSGFTQNNRTNSLLA